MTTNSVLCSATRCFLTGYTPVMALPAHSTQHSHSSCSSQDFCACIQHRYSFDVVTSDLRGAGTDAAVTLELCGSGSSACAGRWVLDRPDAFGRGQTDSFTVEGAGLSSISSLKVTLQETKQSPGWHLDHIVCTVLEGNEGTPGRRYYFVADR